MPGTAVTRCLGTHIHILFKFVRKISLQIAKMKKDVGIHTLFGESFVKIKFKDDTAWLLKRQYTESESFNKKLVLTAPINPQKVNYPCNKVFPLVQISRLL